MITNPVFPLTERRDIFYIKNSSARKTTPQQETATLNRSPPSHAVTVPTASASQPETVLCVAVTIAGKVIIDKVV